MLAAAGAGVSSKVSGASAGRRGRSSAGGAKAVPAGTHHVAKDGALQEHERDRAEDEREHPRNQQIENDGAFVREFHHVRAPGPIIRPGVALWE